MISKGYGGTVRAVTVRDNRVSPQAKSGQRRGAARDVVKRPREADTAVARSHWANGLDWATVFWIGALHVGALAAPFFFTWKGFAVAVVLAGISGCLGICLGYHRLLTHRGFNTYPVVRRALAWLGAMAGEGPPITWIAVHRKHHQFSDQEGDPHSPHDGGWWSHVLWLFPRRHNPQWNETIRRYAPDLLKDPFMVMLDRSFLFWHFAVGAALLGVGWWGWDLRAGLSLLFFGTFVRLVWVLHVTWLVNSASHIWGYRNYETSDDSRNLWWVGLLAYGEGWHNNHHAFQRCARHGHRWWEIDVTYAVIWLMERVGLAWDVVRLTGRASPGTAGGSACVHE